MKRPKTTTHRADLTLVEFTPPLDVPSMPILSGTIAGRAYELRGSLAEANIIVRIGGRQFVTSGQDLVRAVYLAAFGPPGGDGGRENRSSPGGRAADP